jgi:hypothetical protein
MRERVTYIISPAISKSIPAKAIQLSKSSGTGSFSLTHVLLKEHHITFTAEDISPYLWRILRNVHELHIRFQRAGSTDVLGDLPEPYTSRVPPGLHVSFTPLEGRSAKRLCVVLKELFGQNLKCSSPENAFTSPQVISERFASGASRQYFHPLPSLLDLSLYIREHLCPRRADIPYPSCVQLAHELRRAVSMDVDYDAISQTLSIGAIWTSSDVPSDPQSWNDKFSVRPEGLSPEHGENTIEVGVLTRQSNSQEESEELTFAGLLSQLGTDKKPQQTKFTFPARHHPSSLEFSTTFSQPTGLHPTLHLSFPTAPISPGTGCALHAYFTLPSPLFLDKYPFTDPVFLASHNLAALRGLSGETDLEAPEWTVDAWGSAAMLELASPSSETASSSKNGTWEATLPLHLRYMAPQNASHVLQRFPDPSVFWACPSEASGTKFASSPFDRTNMGYDGLFGSNTVYYHGSPVGEPAMVSVPVLDMREAGMVSGGTLGVVLLGTGLVLGALGRGLWRDGFGGRKKARKYGNKIKKVQ